MLTGLDAAGLTRQAREQAGLSIRALAARSGVAASTISRIETGHMDPTTTTLGRVIAATGRTLLLAAPAEALPDVPNRTREPGQAQLRALADAWQRTESGDRPGWTRLRVFLDGLALHPEQVPAAITRKPRRSGSPMMDALLAGIAEKLADDAGIPRPRWTADAPVLTTPWLPPGSARMREAAQRTAPYQLAQRGLFIGLRSLWRQPDTVGV